MKAGRNNQVPGAKAEGGRALHPRFGGEIQLSLEGMAMTHRETRGSSN